MSKIFLEKGALSDDKKNKKSLLNLVKLQQTKGKCEICQKEAFQIHHIDENKSNHQMDNLIVLCEHCHKLIHSGRKNKTSKYLRIYGMTLKDMQNKYGSSETYYCLLHKNGKLAQFLKELNEKEIRK